jgi:hypothetical protein
MSIERVQSLLGEFPTNLSDPVIGYAESVRAALPDILHEAGVSPDQVLEDEIVYIAGIRKLYGIVSSTFWTLQKALAKLDQREIPTVRVGGHRYSFQSPEYRRLELLHGSLRLLLEEENLMRFMQQTNYAGIVRALADERRENQ